MNITAFQTAFERTFSKWHQTRPSRRLYLLPWLRNFPDPCPDVQGMSSNKKLRLLNLAVAGLPADGNEGYGEVGTWRGKSVIAALLGNPGRRAVVCDNFSQFNDGTNELKLKANLVRYGLEGQVRVFNSDFRQLVPRWKELQLPPLGVYFYDGAHDWASQYDGIRLAEPLLADEAVVIVDDWRKESGSEAEAGTMEAIRESQHDWQLLWNLPARGNGDLAMWWNGVAVFSFRRTRQA